MKKILAIVLVLSMFALSACGLVSTPAPTATTVPTQTALPTYTPMPTYTPLPTFTPFPTALPLPTLLPATSSYTVNGVKLTFTSATLYKNAVQMGDKMFTPNPGYLVLIVDGEYTGDISSLFGDNGLFQPTSVFYVSEKDGSIDEWVYEYRKWDSVETDGTIQIAFFVKNGFNPYILVNTIETQFEIDLTTLMSNL